MSSWQFLQRVIVFWDAAQNPIFIRMTAHPPVWRGMAAWAARSTGLALLLGGLGCYVSMMLIFFANSLLILLIPLLALWALLLGLTLGPVIVQEREALTWDILLTTPLDREGILVGKAGGALWWLRDLIRVIAAVVLLFGLGIGLVSLVIVPISFDEADFPGQVLCLASVAMPLISALVFIVDRAQHFALMTLAALVAGTAAPTVRAALVAGTVAALLAWLVDIGLGIGAIALFGAGQIDVFVPSGAGQIDMFLLATLGPSATYLITFTAGPLVIATLATLLVREIAARILWRIMLRTVRAV